MIMMFSVFSCIILPKNTILSANNKVNSRFNDRQPDYFETIFCLETILVQQSYNFRVMYRYFLL